MSFADIMISIYRTYLGNVTFITYLNNVHRNNTGVRIKKDVFVYVLLVRIY